MITRTDIVTCARGWLGTPFHHAMHVKGLGVDCIGLLLGIAKELNLFPASFSLPPYSKHASGYALINGCDTLLARTEHVDMGNIAVISFGGAPHHVGIVGDYRSGGESIIHASCFPAAMRVIEHRLMYSRAMRFVAMYSFRGVA